MLHIWWRFVVTLPPPPPKTKTIKSTGVHLMWHNYRNGVGMMLVFGYFSIAAEFNFIAFVFGIFVFMRVCANDNWFAEQSVNSAEVLSFFSFTKTTSRFGYSINFSNFGVEFFTFVYILKAWISVMSYESLEKQTIREWIAWIVFLWVWPLIKH